MVETGVIGLALFVYMLGMLFRSAVRMSGITRSFWLTMFCVWCIGVCSLTWEYRKPTWLLFGLLAAHVASLKTRVAGPVDISMNRKQYFNPAEAYS